MLRAAVDEVREVTYELRERVEVVRNTIRDSIQRHIRALEEQERELIGQLEDITTAKEKVRLRVVMFIWKKKRLHHYGVCKMADPRWLQILVFNDVILSTFVPQIQFLIFSLLKKKRDTNSVVEQERTIIRINHLLSKGLRSKVCYLFFSSISGIKYSAANTRVGLVKLVE